jgi:hypothetical protein
MKTLFSFKLFWIKCPPILRPGMLIQQPIIDHILNPSTPLFCFTFVNVYCDKLTLSMCLALFHSPYRQNASESRPYSSLSGPTNVYHSDLASSPSKVPSSMGPTPSKSQSIYNAEGVQSHTKAVRSPPQSGVVKDDVTNSGRKRSSHTVDARDFFRLARKSLSYDEVCGMGSPRFFTVP